ncbi:MAG TPA: thioredoxin domain-containing protein [Candidatus Omnitrophota bacterium]|nr:thioredoxin domain-containing protein [Candidatus Omnitrophota bacterium]
MMENKGFKLALVIALGVFLGVLVVSAQKQDALLREVLGRQNQMLQAQMRLDSKVGSQDMAGARGLMQSEIDKLTSKISDLETRLARLESQPRPQQVQQQPTPQQMPPPDTTVHEIPVAHSVVGGAKDGKVTIVEFVDYQCPFCARFHPPMVEAAKAFPGKVKYLLKHFPLSFHPQAKPAAKAALAAGEQGKFWEMTELILGNQTQLTDQQFEAYAKQLGLNVKKYLEDYKNKDAEYEKILNTDMELGGKVGVRGTPSFYINGRVSNSRDAASWKAEIEKLLK